MGRTLSLRTDEELRMALMERARAEGVTLSELIRRILRDAVETKPLKSRIGHLKGCIEPSGAELDDWQRRIRERNWRA
jgi:hypothetical protein